MALALYTKNNILHHAYCIVGNKDEVIKELETFFKKELKFDIVGNPDFWYGEYDSMDIEDARALKDLHQNKPTAGERKIFVISANFITEKAQNAMLKLFEEPVGNTHFFLVLPQAFNILPTLKSRLMILNHYGKNSSLIDIKEFLKMSAADRIEEIKNLMKSITDEEESKIEVTKFINGLELELKKNIKLSSETGKIFEEIEKVRQYASEQSPSLKMLLEHLALILPILNK
jgi:DNA polymerase III delta prime subunit